MIVTSCIHSNIDPVILCCLHLSLSSFRTPEKESISKAVLQKSRGRSQLWAHSKEPLKQPLLKRACTDPDLCDLACQAFTDILSLFSLGPESIREEEKLATSTKLTSIEIILQPHNRGDMYIKVGGINSVSVICRGKVPIPYQCSSILDDSLN